MLVFRGSLLSEVQAFVAQLKRNSMPIAIEDTTESHNSLKWLVWGNDQRQQELLNVIVFLSKCKNS